MLSGGGELFLDLSGGGELFLEAAGGGEAELAYDTALAIGRAAPQNLTACVIGVDCPPGAPESPLHRTYLTWKPPTFGTVTFYRIYRKIDDDLVTEYTEITPTEPTADTSFVDTEELPNGETFLYRVRARYDDGIDGPASNIATITATNNPPLVADDPGIVTTQDVAITIAVLDNDADDDTGLVGVTTFQGAITPVVTVQPTNGTVVLQPTGEFTYTPNPGYVGPDSFKYRADDGKWRNATISLSDLSSSEATVSITVNPIGLQ